MENEADVTRDRPTLAEATKVWLEIGLLSFGGPAGQIALMHKMLVEDRRWISESRFLHALNFCMLLPGPEAQQLATYIGWLLHGTRGGVIAGTLFVLPGFLVIVSLSAAYALFQQADWMTGLFLGLKAAVLAIVVQAVIRVGGRALRTPLAVGLAAIAFLALFLFGVPFPLVVLAAGIAGFFFVRIWPQQFAPGGHEPDLLTAGHDDAAPSLGRAVRIMGLWLVIWAAPLALIVPVYGWDNTYTSIAWFFSQMAVVTFGGAYAVLAYVAQQAVEGFGWLRPGEMIDGLALAETTPGPLVLVLTFVGFIAAFRDPMGLEPAAAGLLGGTLTTWVTFVPCFLWILLGAPYIERLRHNQFLSGALSAITAAVVGVILNLAVWFGLHVLFGEIRDLRAGPITLAWPLWQSLDFAAAALCLAAAGMLFVLRLGVVRTLAICGILGLGFWLLTVS